MKSGWSQGQNALTSPSAFMRCIWAHGKNHTAKVKRTAAHSGSDMMRSQTILSSMLRKIISLILRFFLLQNSRLTVRGDIRPLSITAQLQDTVHPNSLWSLLICCIRMISELCWILFRFISQSINTVFSDMTALHCMNIRAMMSGWANGEAAISCIQEERSRPSYSHQLISGWRNSISTVWGWTL